MVYDVNPELNAPVQISRIWIGDESGDSISNVDISKPFCIGLQLTIFQDLTKFDLGIRVHNGLGQPLFTTSYSDTFGFPPDLTRLIANEQGRTINEAEFEAEMLQQKNRSRAATAMDTEDWILLHEDAATSFVGYDTLEISTRLVRYRKVKAKGKESYQLVLEATPFYAESGGQVGDRGVLLFGEESIPVLDTKKENNLVIHITAQLPQQPELPVIAIVDADCRQSTAIHHSATHLLHAALRSVLGSHVSQKGSLVNEHQLRFDFAHFSKVGEEEIAKIEQIVNEKIRSNITVQIEEMGKEAAMAKGAMALFGEKYGDKVRVVTMDPHYSVELCGGTHINQTGEMGLFKIQHESAVAAGVRRIEAVSGNPAWQWILKETTTLQQVRQTLKNPTEVTRALQQLMVENAELKKKIESLESKQLSQLIPQLLQQVSIVGDIPFIGAIVEVAAPDALKQICFQLKNQLNKYVVVLAANIDGKAQVAILIDDETVAHKQLDAAQMIKQTVAPLIKGGGGGAKTLATAGGQNPSNLQQVIDTIRQLLQ